MFDAFGQSLDHIDYDPFGNITIETHPGYGNRYKFAGREYDATTGLYYNRARYYDPTTGTWTSPDPLGFAAGDANLYRYVGNGPTDGTDPSGLLQEPDDLSIEEPREWRNRLEAEQYLRRYRSSGKTVVLFEITESTLVRLEGGAQLAGAGLQAATSVALFAAPEPTLATKVVATGVGGLAVDNAQAGARKIYYGTPQRSLNNYVVAKGSEESASASGRVRSWRTSRRARSTLRSTRRRL